MKCWSYNLLMPADVCCSLSHLLRIVSWYDFSLWEYIGVNRPRVKWSRSVKVEKEKLKEVFFFKWKHRPLCVSRYISVFTIISFFIHYHPSHWSKRSGIAKKKISRAKWFQKCNQRGNLERDKISVFFNRNWTFCFTTHHKTQI